MNTRINKFVIGFGASALLASAGMATPAGTGFTYQGSLSDGGGPANGLYDLRFGLHAAAAGGSAMTWVDVDDVQVVDGLFNVKIDFGVGWLNGSAKWIEVAVRPGVSTGAYTSLSPRQELTPAPYAVGLALPYHADDNSPNSMMSLTQYGAGPVVHMLTHGTNSGLQSFILNATNPNFAVLGNTKGTGAGVKGISSGTGAAVSGESSGSGDAVAGRATGSGDAIYGQNNGTGNAVFGYNLATSGRAGFFRNENINNAQPALRSEANGGAAGEFAVTSNANNRPAIHATTVGSGQAGAFVTNNASNAAVTLSASTNGAGKAFVATTTGAGVAASVEVNNPASNAAALSVKTNGGGRALFAETTGNGAAIFARSTSFTTPAIEIETGALRAVNAGYNTPTFAYRHIVNSSNIGHCVGPMCFSSRLDHPMLNNNPGAIIFVTEIVTSDLSMYTRQATVGVQYDTSDGHWYLRAQGDLIAINYDMDEDFDEGQQFNILIIDN